MPAVSKAQAGFMGAELSRLEKGQQTKRGMSEASLKDFASTRRKALPARKTLVRKLPRGR